MKLTEYFKYTREHADRRGIRMEWIEGVVADPVREAVQADGRWLRVVLLPDGETVHNAFFDRSFREES